MPARKLFLALALSPLAGACAHQTQPQQQQSLSWEEYNRRYPDTYIASVDQSHAAARQRLEQAGLAADLAAVRSAVDLHLPPGNYTLQATGATAAILRRQRVDSIAQLLVRLGYGSSDVADPKRAATLVGIAARAYGSSEKGDAARLAPTVVLADFVEVVTEPPRADGLRFSSLRYRIVEPLKNAPPAGTLIKVPGGPVHYPDGTQSFSTGDLESMRPGRYVLFMAQPKLMRTAGEPAPATTYTRAFGPLREFNGKFVPVGDSDQQEVTLEELRAAIAEQD